MSELIPRPGATLARTGDEVSGPVRFGVLVFMLADASLTMIGLARQIRATFKYVEKCAKSVNRLADQAASMNVDVDTVGEHRDAATVMLAALEEAEAMAAECEDMSILFHETADAHTADYGPVADAANNMSVSMADREFYSNR